MPLTWNTTSTGERRLLGNGDAGVTDSEPSCALPAFADAADSATGAAAATFDGSVVATASFVAPSRVGEIVKRSPADSGPVTAMSIPSTVCGSDVYVRVVWSDRLVSVYFVPSKPSV